MNAVRTTKARSRIAKREVASPVVEHVPAIHTRKRREGEPPDMSDWLLFHQSQLALLAISAVLLVLLLLKVSPSKVANIGLPESYLPVLLLVAAVVFSASRLFLRRRYALYLTYTAVILLFIQLHQLVITPYYLVFLGLPVVVAHLALLLVNKR